MGAPGYPYPHQQPQPPKKRNAALIVLASVLGGMFLLCGGCTAVVVAISTLTGADRPAVSPTTATRTAAPSSRTATAAPPTPAVDTDAIATEIARERAFIETIDGMGITYVSEDEVIIQANAVCVAIMSNPRWSLSDAVADAYFSFPGMTGEQAAGFVGVAVQAYCPGEAERLGLN